LLFIFDVSHLFFLICFLLSYLTTGISSKWLETGEEEMFIQDTDRKIEEIVSLYRQLNPSLRGTSSGNCWKSLITKTDQSHPKQKRSIE
jgi:hypothetical protein